MDEFQFKNFVPEESLKTKADRALDRILERAPNDAVVLAVVEKTKENFHCKIELNSNIGPMIVEAFHRFASIAVDKAELALVRKLDRWRGPSFSQKFSQVETPPLPPVLSVTRN